MESSAAVDEVERADTALLADPERFRSEMMRARSIREEKLWAHSAAKVETEASKNSIHTTIKAGYTPGVVKKGAIYYQIIGSPVNSHVRRRQRSAARHKTIGKVCHRGTNTVESRVEGDVQDGGTEAQLGRFSQQHLALASKKMRPWRLAALRSVYRGVLRGCNKEFVTLEMLKKRIAKVAKGLVEGAVVPEIEVCVATCLEMDKAFDLCCNEKFVKSSSPVHISEFCELADNAITRGCFPGRGGSKSLPHEESPGVLEFLRSPGGSSVLQSTTILLWDQLAFENPTLEGSYARGIVADFFVSLAEKDVVAPHMTLGQSLCLHLKYQLVDSLPMFEDSRQNIARRAFIDCILFVVLSL